MEPYYIVKLMHKEKAYYIGVVNDRFAMVDNRALAQHFPPPKIHAITAAEVMRVRFQFSTVEIIPA